MKGRKGERSTSSELLQEDLFACKLPLNIQAYLYQVHGYRINFIDSSARTSL